MSRGISQLDGSYKLKLNATFHYQPLPHFEDSFSLVVVLFDADKEIISRQLLNPSPTVSLASFILSGLFSILLVSVYY